MAAKRKFLDGYRTYEGERGNAESWRDAFHFTMGIGEAKRRVGDNTPESILGIMPGASWVKIKSAYRRMAMDNHPDRAALNQMTVEEATERFKRIVAAYTVLEKKHQRR